MNSAAALWLKNKCRISVSSRYRIKTEVRMKSQGSGGFEIASMCFKQTDIWTIIVRPRWRSALAPNQTALRPFFADQCHAAHLYQAISLLVTTGILKTDTTPASDSFWGVKGIEGANLGNPRAALLGRIAAGLNSVACLPAFLPFGLASAFLQLV